MNEELIAHSIKSLRKFAYVGLTNTYGDDLKRIAGLLKIEIPELHINRRESNEQDALDHLDFANT